MSRRHGLPKSCRRLAGRSRRRISLAVALCVVALVTLVASVVPSAPPMRLVALDPDRRAGDPAGARPAGDRDRRIRRPLPDPFLQSGRRCPAVDSTVTPETSRRPMSWRSPTTVIATFDTDVSTGAAASVAYDLRTGQERWQLPGFAGDLLDDGGVVVTAVTGGGRRCPGRHRRYQGRGAVHRRRAMAGAGRAPTASCRSSTTPPTGPQRRRVLPGFRRDHRSRPCHRRASRPARRPDA